jgi:hypothetical protein
MMDKYLKYKDQDKQFDSLIIDGERNQVAAYLETLKVAKTMRIKDAATINEVIKNSRVVYEAQNVRRMMKAYATTNYKDVFDPERINENNIKNCQEIYLNRLSAQSASDKLIDSEQQEINKLYNDL